MNERTITLRADLVERLEAIAQEQGRSINDVFADMLDQFIPIRNTANNWAYALAKGMEAANIE